MNILLIEDNKEKSNAIYEFLEKNIPEVNLNIKYATYIAEASVLITSEQFDLIIIDLLLPTFKDSEPVNSGSEIAKIIAKSKYNNQSNIIALSQFAEVVQSQKDDFDKNNIVLLHYDKDNDDWQDALISCLERIGIDGRLDFVIICALAEERDAYELTSANIIGKETNNNLDLWHLRIGRHKGVCVLLPSMGLVSAAVVTSRIIEAYNPKIVTMSGICGGFSTNCNMGQILIGDPCWEYQTGKWADNEFRMEPHQVALNESVRLQLNDTSNETGLLAYLEENIKTKRPEETNRPMISPFTSGSAVIASEEKMKEIIEQHRKVAGLDMELFGVYKAVKLSNIENVVFFGAKTVVDFADNRKRDGLHEYGSIVSARYVVKAIEKFL